MSELLPCPFCGGEAETLTAESMHGGYLFGIMCNDCRSRGDVYDTEAEAIAAWNSRAERTCRIEERNGDWYCDACGEMVGTCDTASELHIDGNAVELWRYCPNCGARVVE